MARYKVDKNGKTKLGALLTGAAKESRRIKKKSNAATPTTKKKAAPAKKKAPANATTPTTAQERRAQRARVIKAKRLLEGARVIKAKRKATTPTRKKADPCDKDKRTIRQSKRQGGVDMFKCFKAGDTRPKYMDPRVAGTVFTRKTWVLKPDFRKRKVATKTTSRNKRKKGVDLDLTGGKRSKPRKAERRVHTSKASDRERVPRTQSMSNMASRNTTTPTTPQERRAQRARVIKAKRLLEGARVIKAKRKEQRAIDATIRSVARKPTPDEFDVFSGTSTDADFADTFGYNAY